MGAPARKRRVRNAASGSGFNRVVNIIRIIFYNFISAIAYPFVWLISRFNRRPPKITPQGSLEGAEITATKSHKINEPKNDTALGLFARIALIGVTAISSFFLGYALIFSDNSISVTVMLDGQSRVISTKAESVRELLEKNHYALSESDSMNYELTSGLFDGMEINILSAFPVAVTSKGEVKVVSMLEGSVGDALKLAGIQYDAYDEITEPVYTDVNPGMEIQHIDIDTQYETVDQAIEYLTETILDENRYKGEAYEKIKQGGEDGEKRVVRRITYKDGVLASREIMNQIILKEATTEIKIVGTKIRYQTNLTGDTREWKAKPTKDQIAQTMVVTEITAYTHTGNRTATGRRPKVGYVAVNPKIIPYGTRLYIPNYGYCTAQDTGAFRHEQGGMKNQIDLFMNTEKECYAWGRKRNVTIYILK